MTLTSRIDSIDWDRVEDDLLARGYAVLREFLTTAEAVALRDGFVDDERFRSHVVMERHNFGRGEYKYYAYPLPEAIEAMRTGFYAHLAPIANRWNALLGENSRFPDAQQTFLEVCRDADQSRPTALLLRYRPGDYNCLHQDTYGEIAFPFQATLFLSSPDEYEGGEFVMTEQRPRMQTRPIVLRPNQGDVVIIPNRLRPVKGTHGYYRTTFRHGVSE